MNVHPTSCGGPGNCPRCDAIVDQRQDRTPAPLASIERDRQAAQRALHDPANGPQCTVRWRDDWCCGTDRTGLHTCCLYGPHTVHACDASQRVTDAQLAAGSVCADGHPATMRPGAKHWHPEPARIDVAS